MEVGRDGRSGSFHDSRTPDSARSIKHLIAAAQAKKQAHLQKSSNGNPYSVFSSGPNVHGSPSPVAAQTFLSSASNATQVDAQGNYHSKNVASPSQVCQSSNSQPDTEEFEGRRVSSGHRAAGGSLSGGTEAAVARDAFEGMIETLSRTKESIGRATRLAIDCAKYGIANEVNNQSNYGSLIVIILFNHLEVHHFCY